jgi:adenylate cyclase
VAFDGGIVQTTSLGRGAFATEAFKQSPFHAVIVDGAPLVRARIPPAPSDRRYPILDDLESQGATDYLAFSIRLHGALPSGLSFVTRRPGGFTDAQVAALAASLPVLRLALSPLLAAYTTRVLLGAYLGSTTGERVLGGQVERGDVEEIEAAIWFSDLRGFTPMSSTVGSRELIAWLNEYFDAVAGAIARHEGEILKFIGDAVLAVWPVRDDRPARAACLAALDAAREANAALDALNAERAGRGLPAMDHGIGLHLGRAQYGNIGAQGRLDFTVIGPAVNKASRLEGACAKLGRRVVASSELAVSAGAPLVDLGEVELKGVAGRMPVFGLE